MRKSVGTIGTILVASLFGATAQQAQLLAMTEENCLATCLQEGTGKTSGDESSPLSAESVKRLKDIGAGQYQITPSREDVSLVIQALRDNDVTISSWACLAVEKMASKKLFTPEDTKVLWEGLRPKLRSQNEDASQWSARGLGALCLDTEILSGAILDGAFEETLLLVSDNNTEMRRRGAVLSRYLVKRLPKDRLEKLVRTLITSPPVAAEDQKGIDNSEAHISCLVTQSLISSASRIETESLANEMALRLLAESDPPTVLGELGRWEGLAYLAGKTDKETREQIVKSILATVADKKLIYSRTSGVISPLKHHGADGLAILSSFMTLEEIERAEQAIPPQPTGEKKTIHDSLEHFASMYGAAKEALAARKLELQKKMKPAMRVEEDLAFFEKKYKMKITGVKPKGEYSDPDHFYSAIAKELGIPEIAWQAASEKFGWRKDDGRHTFTMLKGGPTAEGGEGTWDVMFIRSTINAETKKPDPATIEQVMVQIDYDGNITFPKIPNGNQ
ncbi:MAG: hypothetical protein JNL67_15800 [Planctomycetaceae bacterium]|nr:hypothetical protein [Planctomycetaceae bacterium]